MTNTYGTLSSFALSLALGLAGCAGLVTEQTQSGLSFDEETETSVRGTFAAGDMHIAFDAQMPEALIGTLEVTIDGKTLSLRADADLGHVVFDGTGASLNALEIAALRSLHAAIADELGRADDTSVMHLSLLFVGTQYLGEAPLGTALAYVEHNTVGVDLAEPFGTGNDGKTCITRGTTRTASYDGSQGTRHESWVVGSSGGQQWNGNFDCMGRCGGACGGGDWTQDCLEHDACGRYYYSSSGPVDSNCGDEYGNAADDYLNFWKRCRG